MIHVTKAYLPPFEKYTNYLNKIYTSGILTNNGHLLVTLEKRLKEYLSIEDLLIVNSGTTALQLAIKAMGLTGEVITTPFSHVATTASLVWEQCTPVYVDIDKDTLCIDASLIERSITTRTTAILATHVFGNACDIEAIRAIADKYGLKVIYDAAHAFGTTYKGHSIFHYGDISITSFHATKLFHMGEGGALFSNDSELLHKLSLLRNFGHTSPVSFDGIGINGKNSELHAAMGLCVLDDIQELLQQRKNQWQFYEDHLPGDLQTIRINGQVDHYNHAYFPVIFPSEKQLLITFDYLKEQHIIPRRYFYPSLNTLNYVNRANCPVSERIAPRVLCLPLFQDLTTAEQHKIISIISQSLNEVNTLAAI